MTLIIPYTSEQLTWHLRSNIFGLSQPTIDKIVEQCNLVNMGQMELEDEIAPDSGITIADMLADIKIEYNAQ